MKIFAVSILLCFSALLCAAQEGKLENTKDMKFTTVPNLPTCVTAAAEEGDPGNGAAILLLKAKTGCDIPMHWHTTVEKLMMVSGLARLEMKDAKPQIMRPAAFAIAPSKHPHHFTCVSACQLYVVTTGAFDIHYVDAKGDEITPEQALKSGKKAGAHKKPAAKQGD